MPPGVQHTGWAVELAGDPFMMHAPVIQLRTRGVGRVSLSDYLVPIPQVPFSVSYLPIDLHGMPGGGWMPLQTVLTSLYRDYMVARPIESFLQELRETLQFDDWPSRRHARGAELVAPKVAEAGFELKDFWQYGTSLHVSLGWVCPQDRTRPDETFCFHAASIEFRPTPALTLAKGKWILPCETTFAHLLSQKLRSLLRGDAQQWLSEAGHRAALKYFKWTKATLLTRAELKQARLEFVRQHPQLHAHPRELARAMKKAELYSEITELYAIVKQLPRMLEEAGAPESSNG